MIFVGLIDWKEYYKHFLIAKNYHVGSIDDFLKDYADERIELKESGIYILWNVSKLCQWKNK